MKCNCFTCPLGKDQYEKYDIAEGDHSYDKEIAYSIWCDKIGSKCGWYGYCEDAFEEDNIIHNKVNKKRSSKRTRREKYHNHLMHLNKIAYDPTPAMHIEEKWDKEIRDYIPVDKPYYKRCYKGNHKGNAFNYYKKYSNKRVRRYIGQLNNGGSYKKVFDLFVHGNLE
jgi:hypothetical protein